MTTMLQKLIQVFTLAILLTNISHAVEFSVWGHQNRKVSAATGGESSAPPLGAEEWSGLGAERLGVEAHGATNWLGVGAEVVALFPPDWQGIDADASAPPEWMVQYLNSLAQKLSRDSRKHETAVRHGTVADALMMPEGNNKAENEEKSVPRVLWPLSWREECTPWEEQLVRGVLEGEEFKSEVKRLLGEGTYEACLRQIAMNWSVMSTFRSDRSSILTERTRIIALLEMQKRALRHNDCIEAAINGVWGGDGNLLDELQQCEMLSFPSVPSFPVAELFGKLSPRAEMEYWRFELDDDYDVRTNSTPHSGFQASYADPGVSIYDTSRSNSLRSGFQAGLHVGPGAGIDNIW